MDKNLVYDRALNENQQFLVPHSLTQKFSGYLDKTISNVLITESEKYDASLLELIKSNARVNFTLTTRQEFKSGRILSSHNELKNVNLIPADIYSYGFMEQKFDLIFCVPVFGSRALLNEKGFIGREPSLIATQNLLYHLNIGGKLVIVLPAKVAFGMGELASLREYIESNYKVEEISILPEKTFFPYTSLRTYLFVISTGKTKDVILKRYVLEKSVCKDSSCEKFVSQDELLLFDNEFAILNNWNVDLIFSEKDKSMKYFLSSSVKKMRLKDIATVFRGKAVNAKSDNGNIAVINISNITDVGINYKNLVLLKEEEQKMLRYALEDGDVLVAVRGTTIKIAIFEKQSMMCIPSMNICVIRLRDMLRGAYLKLFLESPVGIKMLQNLQRGSVVVNINYRDLMDLEVPVLPIEDQDALIKKYDAGLKDYKETVRVAEEKWQLIRQEVQSSLF